MDDPVVRALGGLVPAGIRRGALARGSRMLRWVESGSGAPAVVLEAGQGQPGSLVWAGVLAVVAPHTRVIAYDRAGIGMSDPAAPLTLGTQLGDLTAVIESAGGRCVLAGHSWGGLLAQMVARGRPELIAGLVLVDPTDERFPASLPPQDRREIEEMGTVILDQYSRGVLGDTVREEFRPFAQRLTADPQLQVLVLDAYAWCYTKRSQAQMTRDENQLFTGAVPVISRIRATAALPAVPVIVLSATTGLPRERRDRFTSLHAGLAATVPGSRHVVLPDTGHLIPQERPEQVAKAINRIVEGLQLPGESAPGPSDPP